jgi:hypothetical protein
VGVLSFLSYLLATKSPTDVLLVRNQGMPFVMTGDGKALNTVRVQLTNRTDHEQVLKVEVVDETGGRMEGVEVMGADGGEVVLRSGEMVQKPVHILAREGVFEGGKRMVTVRVRNGEKVIDRGFELFGPG